MLTLVNFLHLAAPRDLTALDETTRTMSYETIRLQRDERVAVVTLDRPDVRNAIDDRMAWEWEDAVRTLDADPTVGAIVMTGAGTSFCAGADVGRFERAIDVVDERAAGGEVGGRAHDVPRGQRGAGPPQDWIALVRAAKPTVVAVNGPCVGAGLTRILPCDVRIASTQATFSMRFVRVGLVPEIGSTQILAQLVGLQCAADLMLSGRTMSAAEAHGAGLVHSVVEPDRLLPEAIALATTYADSPPGTVREVKRLLYANHVEQDLDLVATREVEALERCWGSPENREAVAAFRERRAPDWGRASDAGT